MFLLIQYLYVQRSSLPVRILDIETKHKFFYFSRPRMSQTFKFSVYRCSYYLQKFQLISFIKIIRNIICMGEIKCRVLELFINDPEKSLFHFSCSSENSCRNRPRYFSLFVTTLFSFFNLLFTVLFGTILPPALQITHHFGLFLSHGQDRSL